MNDIKKQIEELEKQGYTEVGASTNETWDFSKDAVFEGVFVEIREGVGQNNSNLYVFEGKDNKRYGVWGSAVLDSRLKNLVVGEETVIIYKGMAKSTKTDRTYKNYLVYHKGGSTTEEEPPLPTEESISNDKDFSEEGA